MTERFMTVSEVAGLLRTPVATLRYWRHVGYGPKSFKVGRHVRYATAEVEAWLATSQTDDAPPLPLRGKDGALRPPAPGPLTDDGAADAAQTMGGSLPPAASSSPTGPGPAAIGGQPGPVPRRFQLYRHTDLSGVSGIGVVAWGVQFPDGAVAVRWHGDHPSTVAWNLVEDAIAIHGHAGATEIRWLDDVPIDLWPAEGGPDAD